MKELIWQIDIRIIYLVGIIAQTIIACAIGMISYSLRKEHIVKNAYVKLNKGRINAINNKLMSSGNSISKYEEINLYLKRNGYKYYYNNMEPSKYVTVKIYVSILMAIFGIIAYGIVGAIVGCVVGYNIINLYTSYLNRKDNKAITDDIRIILAAMRVQGSANIYITDIIKECYYEIKNKRLKKAILEFNGDLRAKKDVGEAVDSLGEKFNNKYIESLCVVIKQQFKSGKSTNMLEYINKQMLALQREMIEKDKRVVEQDQIVSSFLIFVLIAAFIFVNVSQVLNTNLF